MEIKFISYPSNGLYYDIYIGDEILEVIDKATKRSYSTCLKKLLETVKISTIAKKTEIEIDGDTMYINCDNNLILNVPRKYDNNEEIFKNIRELTKRIEDLECKVISIDISKLDFTNWTKVGCEYDTQDLVMLRTYGHIPIGNSFNMILTYLYSKKLLVKQIDILENSYYVNKCVLAYPIDHIDEKKICCTISDYFSGLSFDNIISFGSSGGRRYAINYY